MDNIKHSDSTVLLPEVSIFDSRVCVDGVTVDHDAHFTDSLLTLTQVPDQILQDDNSTGGFIHLSAHEPLNTTLEVSTPSGQVQYIILQRDGQILELQSPAPQVIPIVSTPQEPQPDQTPTSHIEDEDESRDKLECGICGHLTRSVIHFLAHKSTHVARGSGLGCEICNLSFSRQVALTEHYKRKHKIDLVEKKKTKTKSKRQTTDSCKPIKPLIIPNCLNSSLEEENNIEEDATNAGADSVSNEETLKSLVDGKDSNIGEGIKNNVLSEVSHLIDPQQAEYFESCEIRDPDEYLNQSSSLSDKQAIETLPESVIGSANASGLDECEASVAQLLEYEQNCEAESSVSTEIQGQSSACNGSSVEEATDALQHSDESHVNFDEEEEAKTRTDKVNSLIPEDSNVPDLGVQSEKQNISNHIDEDTAADNESAEQGNEPLDEPNVQTENSDGAFGRRKRRRSKIAGNEEDQNVSEGSEKENSSIPNKSFKSLRSGIFNRRAIKIDTSNSDLENSTNKVLTDYDMPDFHFIASLQDSGKKSIKGGKYSFKCLYCDIKLSWRSTMCRHMREKHADILKVGSYLAIPSQVTDNGDRLMKMSEYMQHEKGSKRGKRMRGVEKQDLPGTFPCDKCDKVFNRLRYLRKHLLNHKSEKNFLCSMCVKTFKTVASLNQHMKSHKDREPYKCNECDFVSTFNIAIHSHRQIHRQGCVICEVCGSAYTDKSTLTKHKQVHDKSRPFPCQQPGCTWRFKSKAMCNAHFRTHSTRGKFECRVCKYAFRQKHHLIRHEKTIHNILPDKTLSYRYMRDDIDSHYNQNSIDLGANEKVTVIETEHPCPDEVNMIIDGDTSVCVDGVHDHFDLESALQSGHLVIATDDGSTINYEMSDLSMTGAYQTLLHDGDGTALDSHTILIPQVGSHVVYQHEEVTETIVTDETLQEKDGDSS